MFDCDALAGRGSVRGDMTVTTRIIKVIARFLARCFDLDELRLLNAIAVAEREEIEADRRLGI